VLREQLPRRPRVTDAQRRRLARAARNLPRKTLRELGTIVTPDTLLRWYREVVAAKYDSTASRKLGRPRTPENLRPLVVTMATENPTWGYTRIRGALLNLGHELSCSTIARILKEEGVSPAPDRKTTWKQFLRTHWEAIAAADFFTVEVLTPFGVVRYSVLFVIRLNTRRVEILGINPAPYDEWMRNVARGALDVVDGCLRDVRYLICDRDPLFTAGFRDLLASAGTKVVRLPPRSPDLNSFAERFVGSVRRECLDRVIPLGERHLRRLLHEYVTHYHEERNHQGLGNPLCADDRGQRHRTDPVPRTPRRAVVLLPSSSCVTFVSHRAPEAGGRDRVVEWPRPACLAGSSIRVPGAPKTAARTAGEGGTEIHSRGNTVGLVTPTSSPYSDVPTCIKAGCPFRYIANEVKNSVPTRPQRSASDGPSAVASTTRREPFKVLDRPAPLPNNRSSTCGTLMAPRVSASLVSASSSPLPFPLRRQTLAEPPAVGRSISYRYAVDRMRRPILASSVAKAANCGRGAHTRFDTLLVGPDSYFGQVHIEIFQTVTVEFPPRNVRHCNLASLRRKPAIQHRLLERQVVLACRHPCTHEQ
jgi:putative transposase